MSAVLLERIPGSDPDLKAALAEANLPTDDIEDVGRTFFRAVSKDGRLVGFSGIEQAGGDCLLRSVVVLPAWRGSGLGRALVEATLKTVASPAGVFLATTGAAAFFARLGFVEAAREGLPDAVRQTRQLSSLCPSSATIMTLKRPPT